MVRRKSKLRASLNRLGRRARVPENALPHLGGELLHQVADDRLDDAPGQRAAPRGSSGAWSAAPPRSSVGLGSMRASTAGIGDDLVDLVPLDGVPFQPLDGLPAGTAGGSSSSQSTVVSSDGPLPPLRAPPRRTPRSARARGSRAVEPVQRGVARRAAVAAPSAAGARRGGRAEDEPPAFEPGSGRAPRRAAPLAVAASGLDTVVLRRASASAATSGRVRRSRGAGLRAGRRSRPRRSSSRRGDGLPLARREVPERLPQRGQRHQEVVLGHRGRPGRRARRARRRRRSTSSRASANSPASQSPSVLGRRRAAHRARPGRRTSPSDQASPNAAPRRSGGAVRSAPTRRHHRQRDVRGRRTSAGRRARSASLVATSARSRAWSAGAGPPCSALGQPQHPRHRRADHRGRTSALRAVPRSRSCRHRPSTTASTAPSGPRSRGGRRPRRRCGRAIRSDSVDDPAQRGVEQHAGQRSDVGAGAAARSSSSGRGGVVRACRRRRRPRSARAAARSPAVSAHRSSSTGSAPVVGPRLAARSRGCRSTRSRCSTRLRRRRVASVRSSATVAVAVEPEPLQLGRRRRARAAARACPGAAGRPGRR